MNSLHYRGPRAVLSHSLKPTCTCISEAPFDAEVAYQNLSNKFSQLAGLVATYMSQAPVDRSLRNANAANMAKVALRIVGGQMTDGFPIAVSWAESSRMVHSHGFAQVCWFIRGLCSQRVIAMHLA
jgi:hypothetical protein